MSRQNIYDDPAFFEDFKNKRESAVNFNDCIETPILLSMLPDMRGKHVLDIGCGMGQHAKQYAGMGAASVTGIDISENMLAYAREHSAAENVTYLRMAMEDMTGLGRAFDVVTSSLAFDYAEDFGKLTSDVYRLTADGGRFVFSMSHPMATCWDGTYDRYTRTPDGVRLYANISNYCVEGLRKVKWVADGYELYHRTFSSLVNAIAKAGFLIEECRESGTTDEMRAKYPDMFGGTLHRPDFVFFRCAKGGRD